MVATTDILLSSFEEIPIDGICALEMFAPAISAEVKREDEEFLYSHQSLKDHVSYFEEYITCRYRKQLSALLALPSWSLEFRDRWERSLMQDAEVWLHATDPCYEGFELWWWTCRRCRESVGFRHDPIPSASAPLVWKIKHERLLQEFAELMPLARVNVGHSVKMSSVTSEMGAPLRDALARFKTLKDNSMRGRAWYDGEDDTWIWTTDNNDECQQVASLVVGITGMDSGRSIGPNDWTWLDWLRQEERAEYSWDYERDRTGKMAAFETGRFADVLKTSITNLQRLLDQATIAKFSPSANEIKGIVDSTETAAGAAKTRPKRRTARRTLSDREKTIRRALRQSPPLRGDRYVAYLDGEGLNTRPEWQKTINDPCPTTHQEAYKNLYWREIVQKEKSRVASKMNRSVSATPKK